MFVLVTYDVSTETAEGRSRLRKVAAACEDYGQRVQYSVFECSLDEKRMHRFRERLLKIIDQEEDSLRIYRIPGSVDEVVEEYGEDPSTDFHGPLIV